MSFCLLPFRSFRCDSWVYWWLPRGWPFVSQDSALGLVLVDLYPLLLHSLDWFRSIRGMSVEVRSSELDTGLSSSDKAMEVDTTISEPSSLNPLSSS